MEMQRVARSVAAENAALKGLLATKGVAMDEVEAHLQTSGITKSPEVQTSAVPQPGAASGRSLPPLSVREDLAGTRESRQMQYDPRLDAPYKMPSPAPSTSSSVMASTPSVPVSTPLPSLTPVSCGPSPTSHMALPMSMPPQPVQPRPCSPVIPMPRLGGSMDRSLPPLQQQPQPLDLSPKRQGSSSSAAGGLNGLRLPMVLDKPPSMIQPQAGCYAHSNVKPKLGCHPKQPQVDQSRCYAHSHAHSLPRPHMMRHHCYDQTHCVEAASILARLRGQADESMALSALGCSDNRDCMVRNADLVQLMD